MIVRYSTLKIKIGEIHQNICNDICKKYLDPDYYKYQGQNYTH